MILGFCVVLPSLQLGSRSLSISGSCWGVRWGKEGDTCPPGSTVWPWALQDWHTQPKVPQHHLKGLTVHVEKVQGAERFLNHTRHHLCSWPSLAGEHYLAPPSLGGWGLRSHQWLELCESTCAL